MTTINDTLHVDACSPIPVWVCYFCVYIIYLFIIITIIILLCVGGERNRHASLVLIYVAARGQTTAVTRSYHGH